MTIKQMVEYLQKQGFWVAEPDYRPQDNTYRFMIGKDGNISTERITIPDHVLSMNHTYVEPLLIKSYCEPLIEKYNKKFGKKEVTAKGITHTWTDPATGKEYGYSWGFGQIGDLEFKITEEGNITVHRTEPNKIRYNDFFRGHLTIRNVIFNPPATIVFWGDGTKTVVKADNETFDPEKGLAMAISKKVLGNKGNYFNHIKKWTENYKPAIPDVVPNKLAEGLYPTNPVERAYNCLVKALHNKKSLKDDLLRACSDALKHMTGGARICADVSAAYDMLANIMRARRPTKIEIQITMEEAIGYLGAALDE